MLRQSSAGLIPITWQWRRTIIRKLVTMHKPVSMRFFLSGPLRAVYLVTVLFVVRLVLEVDVEAISGCREREDLELIVSSRG